MRRELIDRLLSALVVVTLAASVVIAWRAPEYFQLTFAAEDRLVENATAVFLLVASLVLVSNAWRLGARGMRRAMAADRGLRAAVLSRGGRGNILGAADIRLAGG